MTDLIPRAAAIGAIERWWMCSQTTWQSPMTILRAIPTIDPAAIREAALREASELVRSTAYTSNGDNRSLEPVATGLAGMDMHHATIAAAILALIGEKK